MACIQSNSSDEAQRDVKNIVFVVIKGLRSEGDSAGEYRSRSLWDAEWHTIMGMGYINKQLTFDTCIDTKTIAMDFLSPPWFDQQARDLLNLVKGHQGLLDEETRLVFFAENIGGIVLKRALIIADSEKSYDSIPRITCACILCGVPQQVSSLEEWSRIMNSIVVPIWRFLPESFWESTISLLEYLARTSAEFIEIAFRIAIVSVCQRRPESRDEEPAVIGMSCGSLDVSHENIVQQDRPVSLRDISRFSLSAHRQVRSIYHTIDKAASASIQALEYMKTLSRFSPFTRFPENDGVRPVLDAIMAKMNESRVFVIIRAGHGAGKSVLSYALYKKLIRDRGPKTWIVYFAFDRRDHRRESESSMLSQVIRQLLANQPALIDPFLEHAPSEDLRWTEGNLWVQLRFIIRQTTDTTIHLVVDSVTTSDNEYSEGFLRRLFDLELVAPGRLKIWCTSDEAHKLPAAKKVEYVYANEMSEFTQTLAAFQDHLSNTLTSENPKLATVQEQLRETLQVSEGFHHSVLLAHCIRRIDSLSTPDSVERDLKRCAKSYKNTISSIVEEAPAWVTHAVSSMMFARRPLKSTELAVIVALIQTGGLEPGALLDERFIPRDIERDLRQWLGPLITVEKGELRIAHAYVDEILRDWLETLDQGAVQRHRMLTRLIVEYIHDCLAELRATNDIDKLRFSLLEYALEHWHVHYRKQMEGILQPSVSMEEDALEQRAMDLLDVLGRSASIQVPGLASSIPDLHGDSRTNYTKPIVLAARLGLFGIFKRLFDSALDKEKLEALRIACRNSHRPFLLFIIRAQATVSSIACITPKTLIRY